MGFFFNHQRALMVKRQEIKAYTTIVKDSFNVHAHVSDLN